MKNVKKKHFLIILITILAICTVFTVCAFAFANANSGTPTLKIVAKNLSFSDSIYLKYAVAAENVDNLEDIKLLVWTAPQDDYVVGTQEYTLSADGESTVAGNKCAIFNFKALAAKQMTDVVYCRAYIEKNGSIYYSQAEKYSILQYAYNKLGYTGTPTDNEELAALLSGMLQYGASAQGFFNYNTDSLATDTFVKVSLNFGTFDDGFSTTLAKPGTKLTVTAPNYSDNGTFVYWTDSEGNIISKNKTFEITVGEENTTLSAVYTPNQGGNIEGAGATLSNDSFALTEHKIDTSNAINKNASELNTLLSQGVNAEDVYRVSDDSPLYITSSVNGNGATIVASNGIVIDSLNDARIENLIIIGDVSIINSNNVTLDSVEIQGNSTALSIDSDSTNIHINDSRFITESTAIYNLAYNTAITNSYIHADSAILSDADDTTVYNCIIYANSIAIDSTGEDVAVNHNSITTLPTANAVTVGVGSVNSLLSYNLIKGSENSIKINGASNTVVLFNSVYCVSAENNTNTYIVENSLGGQLRLANNNYLLCDANSYVGDADHAPRMSGNDNVNGDSLMDITARNEIGVKEELLPHTNKDLFLEMERKTTVKDIANGTSYDLNAYIEENAKTNSVVIVPPGAYTTIKGEFMELGSQMSNTDIYAFGVYNEHQFITNEEYLADTTKPNWILRIIGASNITINGLTNAYDYQALGQAHVLEKLDDYQIRVVPSAGFDLEAGWGLSNPGVFRGSFYACHKGEPTPWFETSYTYIRTNEDKTIIIKLSETDYNRLGVGDILCTRMAGDNQQSITVSSGKNILFKDCVLHGYAAALGFVVGGNSENVKLERVHNTPKAPTIIDEATYSLYASLEKTYAGVDFEMYVDAEGRYRGTSPRFCSVDATHVSGSSQGLDIESCLFEQMCDDGSNQHGTSSRLHSIKDNGNGTATIYIKGNVTQVYHGIYTQSTVHERNMNPIGFVEGDNIFVYTPAGEVVCDAICLSNSTSQSQLSEIYYLGEMTYYIHVTSVIVPIESVNFDALKGYDLKDNHYRMTNKITVDNISSVSGSFTIDNYLIRNSWSRGVLTKTVNATIKNSTFTHIKSAGILGNCEPEWGESTIPRYITVENCIFDETGYAGESWDNPKNAPVYISGLSTYGEANIHKIVSTDFTVKGCEFRNYGHQYGICIDGAQNVKIIDNIFDPITESAPGNFIKITTAVNVEISGNKYRDENGTLTTISGIDADDYADIHGSDVEGLFPHEFDIYISGTHLSNFKIVPADKNNIIVGNILSSKLKSICGYSVASTVMPYTNEIKLVVNDSESNLIKSNTYVVECIDGQLVITAETNSALIYAVEDFAAGLLALKNQGQMSIYFDEGYSKTSSFALTEFAATNENVFKYTGVWNTNGSNMVSGADADYVEFNFTGHTFTLLFNGETTFKVSFDSQPAVEYTVSDEMTFTLAEGDHTVRILCTDTTKPINFSGLRTFSSSITKTANAKKYIQFIGDSMVDYDTSFAHRIGDILGWDYSVVVGNTLPTTSVSRAPDVFVIFLGTDAITSNSTADEIKAFKTTYKNLITSITSKYSSAKVYIMQPLSTSDASDMFNTSHNRYAAINAMKGYSLTGTFDNYSIASNKKVQIIESTNKLTDWGIEFDTSISATYPTVNGDYTVTVNLAKYLLTNVDSTSSNYINATVPLSGMKGYPTSGATATTVQTPLTEDGVTFTRFSFVQYGHAWLNGNDFATISVDKAGRYLVLMYRASGEANLTLETRTNDYGTDAGEYGNGYISSITKTENNVPEDWEIAIIDLKQFDHYTVGLENTKIQLRISTESDTLDIAYAAIVDDLIEAEMAAMFDLGATQYKLYEDWDKVGTDISLNGLEPEKPFDASFVNQEFGILGMKGYNASPKLNINTEEGVDFTRFNFSTQGHVFLTGANNFVEISGDTGRYLILKYRSTNNTYISLNALTSDFDYTNTGTNMATKTKPAANINSGVWETAVIDLSAHVNTNYGTQYTTDGDLSVWIRLTTGVSEIDISYCALVDDLEEAESFINYKGDNAYVHYTDWSKTGVTITIK